MTISIASGLNYFKKAPQPQSAPLDDVGKFLLNRNVFGGPTGPVRSAKASAAFFNAQGMMTRETGNAAATAAPKTASTAGKLFGKLKNAGASAKQSIKDFVTHKPQVTGAFTKSGAKKALKYGAAGLLIAGAAVGLYYLGKKAYAALTAPKDVEVKQGDNLWNIAKQDLTKKGKKVDDAEIAKRTDELMKLNGLKYEEDKPGVVIIKPGDKIKVK